MVKRIIRIIGGFLIITLLITIVSCGKSVETTKNDEADLIEIKMIILGTEPEEGLDRIYEELDGLSEKELGVRVRFTFIPWGNEREQLNIAVASGEYDIIPNGNFSDYKDLIRKNAFLDISDYFEYAPELESHYNQDNYNYLEDCYINGSLYGIPQYNEPELLYDSEGFFYRKDLLEEWGLDEIHDINTMEKYLYRAKEDSRYSDKPLITDNRIWQSLWIMLGDEKYVEVESMQETPFIVFNTETNQIVNRLETPEFKEILAYITKWSADGILTPDMLSLSDNEGTRGIDLMVNDQKPCETNVPIWAISGNAIRILSEKHRDWKFDFFPYISCRERYYIDSPYSSSVVSISSKSAHPILALRLIEKIHTDSRYYNLFQYGAKGINYEEKNGCISYDGITSSNRFCYSVLGDYLLNKEVEPVNYQFYEDAVLQHEMWEEETLKKSSFNPISRSGISKKILPETNISFGDIQLQYMQPLVCGYYKEVDYKLEELLELLKTNGLDEYIQSINSKL